MHPCATPLLSARCNGAARCTLLAFSSGYGISYATVGFVCVGMAVASLSPPLPPGSLSSLCAILAAPLLYFALEYACGVGALHLLACGAHDDASTPLHNLFRPIFGRMFAGEHMQLCGRPLSHSAWLLLRSWGQLKLQNWNSMQKAVRTCLLAVDDGPWDLHASVSILPGGYLALLLMAALVAYWRGKYQSLSAALVLEPVRCSIPHAVFLLAAQLIRLPWNVLVVTLLPCCKGLTPSASGWLLVFSAPAGFAMHPLSLWFLKVSYLHAAHSQFCFRVVRVVAVASVRPTTTVKTRTLPMTLPIPWKDSVLYPLTWFAGHGDANDRAAAAVSLRTVRRRDGSAASDWAGHGVAGARCMA